MVGIRHFAEFGGAPHPGLNAMCGCVREEDGMKKTIVGAGLAVAIATASAQAADLPRGQYRPYAPPPVVAAYSWMGPYVGANLGYQWGDISNNRPSRPASPAVCKPVTISSRAIRVRRRSRHQLSGAEDTFAPWKFSIPGSARCAARRVCDEQHPVLRDRRPA